MFGSRPLSILILKNRSLETYPLQAGETGLQLAFPNTVVDNLEVIDRDALRELCISFFAQAEIEKKSVGIILDSSVLFSNSVTLTPDQKESTFIRAFRDALPFEELDQWMKIVRDGKSISLFGTNSAIVSTVQDVLEEHENKVRGILPIDALTVMAAGQPVEVKHVQKAFQNKKFLEKYGFPVTVHVAKPKKTLVKGVGQLVQKKKSGNGPVQYVGLAVSVLILGGALYFAYTSLTQSSGAKKSSPTPSPASSSSQITASSSPEPSPTALASVPDATASAETSGSVATSSASPASSSSPASAATLTKNTVTLQILNGSGVPGEAGKIKDQLIALGYKNITTANGTLNTGASIVVHPNVPQTMRTEIQDQLKKTFSTVTLKEDAQAPADIVITTGK